MGEVCHKQPAPLPHHNPHSTMDYLDDLLSLFLDLFTWKDWGWKHVVFYLCLILLLFIVILNCF